MVVQAVCLDYVVHIILKFSYYPIIVLESGMIVENLKHVKMSVCLPLRITFLRYYSNATRSVLPLASFDQATGSISLSNTTKVCGREVDRSHNWGNAD